MAAASMRGLLGMPGSILRSLCSSSMALATTGTVAACPAVPSARCLSTTAAAAAKAVHTTPATAGRWLPEPVPAYPYGPNINYEPANWGLYGGATLQSGNKISKGRNKGKTRRTWAPHIKEVEFHSEALGETLKLRVQHRVERTIAKCGGIDNYLMGEKPARIQELGVFGWKLRWRVMNSPEMVRRLQAQRAQLGGDVPLTYAEFKLQRAREYSDEVAAFRAEKARYDALSEEDKMFTPAPEWTTELEAKKAWLAQEASLPELAAEVRRERRRAKRARKAQRKAVEQRALQEQQARTAITA
ncbi:39S ribosomal protein L24, mitochondrial [Ascosphaera acerosa]|nr:39S ribosomal protein L24, mitochondrial [Ascosphaera acerosa]